MSEAALSPASASYPRLGVPWPNLNQGLTYHDVVRHSDSERTLIEFYSSKYENSAPLQGWLQRIQNGQVIILSPEDESNVLSKYGKLRDILRLMQITVDGEVVRDPSTVLRAGSKLAYHRLPWKEPDAPYLLEILYEDDDMIALNKPSGLQVLPGGLLQQRTVLTQLQWWVANHGPLLRSRNPHPVPVHRLGRGTSGILLCAKTKPAKTQLSAFFAEGTSFAGNKRSEEEGYGTRRKITKIYRALVNGIIHEDKVIIKQPIGIIHYPGVAKGLYVAASSGKPAFSEVNVLERDIKRNCTLVQVEIQSGRPHQIRIHLSYIGHPLLGDPLYTVGGQPPGFDHQLIDVTFAQDGGYQKPLQPVPGDSGYYLHAHQVVLSHPITDEVLKITAPLPPALRALSEGR